MDLGPLEILLVLAVVVMIFGVGKLPEIGGAVGKSIREFRNASHEEDNPPKIEEPKPAQAQLDGNVACPGCGAANSPAMRFCTACGRSLTPAA